MIYYIVRREHSYVIDKYLESWGFASTAAFIRPLHYEQLWKMKKLPSGTYIFADIERLAPNESEMTAKIWRQLSDSEEVRLLKHPTRSKRRYSLLRTLYSKGFNTFNVYRPNEYFQPKQYPVFIRGENDHEGNLTALIETPQELEKSLNQLLDEGYSLDDKLITEFCSTVDQDGIFRKYSAFIVGDKIIPRHLFFSHDWMIKSPKIFEEQQLAEEYEYVRTNPHQNLLKEIFELAEIEYGRIDYSLSNGIPQVWEINTNPSSLSFNDICNKSQQKRTLTHQHFAQEFALGFAEINLENSSKVNIPTLDQSNKSQDSRTYQLVKNIFLSMIEAFPYRLRLTSRRMAKLLNIKLKLKQQV